MRRRNSQAFSMVELLTVLSIIGILASLLIVALSSGHAKSKQAACVNNLHQLGLGFTGFALDHEGRYPMDMPARLGGSLEFGADRVITNTRLSRSYQHFLTLSNDAPNVKVMTCPSDRYHRRAENYQSFGDTNLSYWANPAATPHATLDILAGDWNVAAVPAPASNSIVLKFGREVHSYRGSVLFADGRVEITRSLVYADAPPAGASTNRSAPVKMPPSLTIPGRPSLPARPADPAPPATTPAQAGTPSGTVIPVADLFKPAPVATSSNIVVPSYLFKFKTAWQRSLRGQGGGGVAADPKAPSSRPRAVLPEEETPATMVKPEGGGDPGLIRGVTAASYLFSLLLALVVLLFLYLRSRLNKRKSSKPQE